MRLVWLCQFAAMSLRAQNAVSYGYAEGALIPMKIDRMFKIVYLLMGRDRMTVGELAEHLEVSTRTVHRDIESLMQAGIPLYTSRGSEGGVSLMDGFVLDKTVLSGEEQAQVLLGLQSLPKDGALDGTALRKLKALFGGPESDWIEVDFSRWGYKQKDDTRFETLRSAILLEQSIRFRYASSHGSITEREAYPLKLVFKSRAWYLQAFCLMRNQYRTFRVTRMIDIGFGDGHFDRDRFDVPKLEAEGPRSFELVTLELVFEPHVASRVYDEFDVDAIEVSDEGGLHVCTPYPDGPYLYDLLSSFGSAVEVLQPECVRRHLAGKGVADSARRI